MMSARDSTPEFSSDREFRVGKVPLSPRNCETYPSFLDVMRFRDSVLTIGVLLSACAALASARVEARSTRTLVERLTFEPTPGAVLGELPATNGRFVAIDHADGSVGLIDERSGEARLITNPNQEAGCGIGYAIVGPWLTGSCTNQGGGFTAELYAIATGLWRSVPVPDCFDWGDGGTTGSTRCGFVIGSDWLTWSESCQGCDPGQGVVALNSQDLPLKHLPRTSPTTLADLGSPTLLKRLCAPLRNTSSNRLQLDTNANFTAGQVGAPIGRFAIAVSARGKWLLERCGTRHQFALSQYPITGNSTELIFYSGAGSKLTGIFLPSLRPFSIHVPAALLTPNVPSQPQLVTLAGIELSSHVLYVVGRGGELWQAPAPIPPAPNR